MSQTTEELAATFDDIENVLSQPVLEDRIRERVDSHLRYREAFRNYDATNINSSVVELPIPKDEMDRPTIVGEGAEFPRTHEEYDKQRLEFDKFGFELAITMEAREDSTVSMVDDQLDERARQMREDMNERAFDAITASLQGSLVSDGGSADGTMTYEDLLAGREELVSKSFNPDLLIADVSAVHDLLGSSNFLEATEVQSNLRRSGQIGQIAGMDVVEDDSGLNLTGTSNPGALMVDTDHFGWEGVRTEVTAEEYGEERSQSDVYRLFTRMGWLVTRDDAGVIVEG